MESKRDKKAGKHGWSGKWAGRTDGWKPSSFFSVGIFKWIPTKDGKGIKKSAVKYRIHGSVNNPKAVYDRADEICNLFDAGLVGSRVYMKGETVKG